MTSCNGTSCTRDRTCALTLVTIWTQRRGPGVGSARADEVTAAAATRAGQSPSHAHARAVPLASAPAAAGSMKRWVLVCCLCECLLAAGIRGATDLACRSMIGEASSEMTGCQAAKAL
eukprot:scaffold114871_cov22-Tisochrysis_lutea.AAC.1